MMEPANTGFIMLRNAIVIGLFIGTSASVPLIYQAYPEVVQALTAPTAEPAVATSPEPARTVSAAPSTQMPTGRKFAIEVDRSGHYFGDFRLNGRKVEALIDTGASAVAINLSTARKLGMSIQPSDMTSSVTTANGKARAMFTTLERIEIGRISVDNVQALVLEDQALSTTLIGMTFLNRLKSFKVDRGTLVMAQ